MTTMDDPYMDDPLMDAPRDPGAIRSRQRRPRLRRRERVLLDRALADPQVFERMMRRMWRARRPTSLRAID